MSSVNNPGLGSEFEVLLPAYLALKLLKNEEIKDFRMRSNVKGIEKFDDVLIDLEMENGHQHHLAIQLKHKERKHGKLLPSSFHTGTDFNLEKYCEAYHKLDSDEYKCVIFTNASFDSKKLKDVKKFTMALSENDFVNNLLNSDIDNGNVYKFEVNEETDNKEKFEKFFQQFFLFVAQNNTKELEDRIKNIFENEYSATDVKISTEFINLFRKWHKRQFTNDTLDRKTLSVHLVDLLLENFLIKSSNGIINRDKKLNLLENCVRMFDVTVIEDLKVKFVSDMGKCEDTNCLPSYIDKAVKKLAKDFEIVDDCLLRLAKEHKFVDRNSRELKLQEKVKIFNYLCGKPLIINYDEKSKDQVAKVLEMDFKTSIKMNFVLVGKEIDQTQFNNLKIFKTLQDLRRGNNPLYQKIINEINISVQGRENIKLEKIITSYPELTNIIKVKHLCQDEHLKVGEKLEELPEYYIPRKVSVAVLDDVNILEELINKNHLLVINYRREKQYLEKIARVKSVKLIDIDKFMKENGYLKNMKNEEKYIVVTREMCIKDKFDKICNMTNDSVSFLKINKERKFILIKSKNDEIKTTFLNEIEALINFSHGINVICAEPGMGKTSLMKNFRNQCSSDQWTVFVELRQFGSLFDQSEFKIDEILDNFFKKTDEDVIASEMRNIFLKKNRITFFLDGLDELESKCIDNVLIFVKQLKEKGFTVWLSSRNNIKDKIERELNLFSIDVNEANEEQQKEYINSRLKPYNYSEDEINEIIDNIFVSVGIQNNASILGIPLQLFMLTQIFIDDKSSNQNNSKLTEKQFILTKLYKKYFEGKIKHSLQKDGLTNESNIKRIAKAILKDYQISALRSCLDEEDFRSLNLKQSELYKDEKFINEVKKNGDNYGIIKNVNENKTVTFVHHTHAEYFAAIYLSENVDKVRILGESFLSQKYDNLRFLFDIKLAEDKPLHLSIIYRNLDQFNEIIKNGCDLKDKGGRTPLHLACVCGTKYSPLKYKEDEHYYDVPSNVKDENDSFMKITDKLVELCPVMTKDEIFEWDEIDYATKCWSLYPLQEILKQQQNEQDLNQVLEYKRRHWILKIIDFRKYTPSENWENKLNLNENKEAIAYYSVRFGYQILLKILLVCCDFSLNEWKYEQTRDTLLHQACTKGHKEIVHLLFNHGAKVNIFDSHESTPLHYACMYGHTEIALFLIQNDAEVNRIDADLDTSLYLACKNGHKETAHLLIKNKADVNSVGRNSYTPLHRACLNGHTEIALLLIQSSANINSVDEDGDTPLHCACLKGHTEIALVLIQNNADVNSVGGYGYTPLHRACLNGYTEIVLLLIQNSANINSVDEDGDTSLHCACLNGHIEIALLLIQNNADVNSVGQYSYTPLHRACLNGYTEIVLLLIQNSANINSVDEDGDTPLHCACLNGHIEIAILLIRNNAEVNKVNKYVNTPLHLACKYGYNEIAHLLIENSAIVNCVDNYSHTPLHRACNNGHTETALLLIQNNADVNSVCRHGYSPLHRACLKGDTEIALLLIQNSANINSVDEDGDTPLHCACLKGYTEIALLLIQNNADVNSVGRYGYTPLHRACLNGYTEIVLLLIQNSANINSVDEDGDTPLHCACLKGHTEIALLLIQINADVNSVGRYGYTPLHRACLNGYTEIVLLLIQNSANINSVDEDGDTPLHCACLKGHTEIALLLIQNNADVNSVGQYSYTPLHRACLNGYTEIVLLLIQNSANMNSVDKDGDTPLHCACLKGHAEIALLLIQNNADVNSVGRYGYTPLHRACLNGYTEIVLLLIQNSANINSVDEDGDTPLHCACLKGYTEIALLLIQNNADVNSVGRYGYTPLHRACLNGYTEIVLLLIQNSANMNSVDEDGDTPLHCACLKGHTEIALLLIQNNADVNSVGQYSYTPLHRACLKGDTEIAILLIQNNSDVNCVNEDGGTPLHCACFNGHIEIAILLIRNNAEVNKVNKYVNTPLHLACKYGYNEIAHLLIENSAIVNCVGNYSDTPLHRACDNGHTETVHLLIQNNADVNSVGQYGDTPLHRACLKGHTEIVLSLIQNKAEVNRVNKFLNTPLHLACFGGHKEIAHVLIQNNADVNCVNGNGYIPLLPT